MELNESRKMFPISEIHPRSSLWTCAVQVMEKHTVQTTAGRVNEKKTYRRYILIDEHGTKVTAVVYKDEMSKFDMMLQPYKRYLVSNAKLMNAVSFFKVGTYEYTWVLNNVVVVEPIDEQTIPRLPCSFTFTPFKDMFRFADSDNLIDVKAIVVEATQTTQQPEKANRTEFIIVNEEKQPLLLTLWNSAAEDYGTQIASRITEFPLLVASKVKVNTFNGLSLSSRVNSYFMVDPPINEPSPLKEWYLLHKDEVKEMVKKEAHKDLTMLFPPSAPKDVITVDHFIKNSAQKKAGWISGFTSLVEDRNKFHYVACANCHKSYNACLSWVIKCLSCGQEAGLIVRSRVALTLWHRESSIEITMYTSDVQDLTAITPDMIQNAHEFSFNIKDNLLKRFEKKKIVCFIKSYEKDTSRGNGRKFSVLKAYPYDLVFDDNIGDSSMEQSGSPSKGQIDSPITPSRLSPEHSPTASGTPDLICFPSALQNPVSPPEVQMNVPVQSSETQFFTPTTKTVLKDIAEASNLSLPQTPAKRNLSFGAEVNEANTLALSVMEETPANSSSYMSPGKKTKDKEKMN